MNIPYSYVQWNMFGAEPDVPDYDAASFTCFLFCGDRSDPTYHALQNDGQKTAVCRVFSLDVAVFMLSTEEVTWRAAFIDIDSVLHSSRLLDGLLRFRSHYPHIPIVCLSNAVAASDFGTTRLPLCDLTVRTEDMETLDLDYVLSCAASNNAEWQARVDDLLDARLALRH